MQLLLDIHLLAVDQLGQIAAADDLFLASEIDPLPCNRAKPRAFLFAHLDQGFTVAYTRA